MGHLTTYGFGDFPTAATVAIIGVGYRGRGCENIWSVVNKGKGL